MKHILCIIGQLGNGGSEKQLFLFLKHLDKQEYTASVFVSRVTGGTWEKRITEELDVDVVFGGKGSYLSKIIQYRKEVKKRNPDLIFSWSFFTNPFKFASGKIPFIGSLRGGIGEERAELNGIHFKLALKPDFFVVNSLGLARELRQEGIPQDKIFKVQNIHPRNNLNLSAGEKEKIRQEYGVPANAVVVAGGGRNSASKDFPFWMDSFEKAADKNPDLFAILFGDGPKALLVEEAEKRGLSDRMVFTGVTSKVGEILAITDIFFLSSLYEGLPNVVLEAIDASCKIISTDTAGIRDIFAGEDEILSSVLIPERTPQIAGEMLVNLAAKETSEQERKEESARILAKFSHQEIIPKYLNAINRYDSSSGVLKGKKKIICLIGQIGNGGTEKQLYLFLKNLNREKYVPFVVVSSSLYIAKWGDKFERDLDIQVKTLGALPAIFKMLFFKKLLWGISPDVVFSWSFYTNPFISVCGKIPFVGTLRGGIQEEKKLLKSHHFRMALKPRKFVVNSRTLKDEMLYEGVNEQHVRVITNIFEPLPLMRKDKLQAKLAIMEEYKFPENALIICGGGGISISKNFPFWLDTFEKISKKNDRVYGILFGHGPIRHIADEIEKRGLSNKINLTGDMPDISQILQASDIFFLSSVSEGMPNVLLEAIAEDCVPFSTEVGGVDDIFQTLPTDLRERILLQKFDAEIGVEKLLLLLEDEALRARIMVQAKKVLSEFSAEKIMGQYLNMLFPD